MLEQGQKIPKVHDLTFLGRKAGIEEKYLERCDILSHVYMESRYPDIAQGLPYQKFGVKRTEEHISIAKEVLLWVEDHI